jgi:hypothetical protein
VKSEGRNHAPRRIRCTFGIGTVASEPNRDHPCPEEGSWLGLSDANERARGRVHEPATTMNVSLPGPVLGFCLLFLGGCNAVDRGSVASRGKEAPTEPTGGEASPRTARPGTHLDPPSGEIVRIRLIDPDAQPAEVAAGPDGATDDPEKIASKPSAHRQPTLRWSKWRHIRVSGKTYLSFDFGMSFVRNGEKISWATITAVKPNSEASAAGLRAHGPYSGHQRKRH